MQKRPKLLRRDVKSLAEQIVTRTSPFFQRLDQDPIVRIVADADSMRRLQKALRREWRGNVQFCLVSPEKSYPRCGTRTCPGCQTRSTVHREPKRPRLRSPDPRPRSVRGTS